MNKFLLNFYFLYNFLSFYLLFIYSHPFFSILTHHSKNLYLNHHLFLKALIKMNCARGLEASLIKSIIIKAIFLKSVICIRPPSLNRNLIYSYKLNSYSKSYFQLLISNSNFINIIKLPLEITPLSILNLIVYYNHLFINFILIILLFIINYSY